MDYIELVGSVYLTVCLEGHTFTVSYRTCGRISLQIEKEKGKRRKREREREGVITRWKKERGDVRGLHGLGTHTHAR